MCVLYFAIRILDTPKLILAAALAASVVATLLVDQQIALFCALWLVVVVAFAAYHRWRDLLDSRFLVCVTAVALLSVAPAYLFYYRPLTRDLGYTVPGAIEAFNYSVPLSYIFSPVAEWRTYGAVLPVGLIGAFFFPRRLPGLRPWIIGSVAFMVLTMGPVIHGTDLPLPFALIRHLPGMRQFRTPYRFQIPAALGLSLGAGILISHLVERWPPSAGRRLLAGITAIIVCDLFAHRVVLV